MSEPFEFEPVKARQVVKPTSGQAIAFEHSLRFSVAMLKLAGNLMH